MENASKALLMASGILLVMLIVSLVIFAWSRFSDFYNSEDELQDVEDVAKFNLQFNGYQDRDVNGYELISLANKIADYNMRFSNYRNTTTGEEAKNDKYYSPIKMTISLGEDLDQFRYKDDVSDRNALFTQHQYEINGITNFIETAAQIEGFYEHSDIATRLAKSIGALLLDDDQLETTAEQKGMTTEQLKKSILDSYNSIVGGAHDLEITSYKDNYENINNDYNKMKVILTKHGNIMKYYEYYQFKKGKFKCTKIAYYGDNTTDTQKDGRVKSISFEFTGFTDNME